MKYPHSLCRCRLVATAMLSALLTMAVSSCGDAEFEYSNTPCYLIIDNSLHHDATLASALTRYSGDFVTISTTTKSGARYFVFNSNHGNHSESIFKAEDDRRSLVIGSNGALILGYGYSADGVLYAYDRECPNCFSPNVLPMKSYPLTVSETGIATCNKCKRQYDLNNGGFITSGDKGKKVKPFHCSATSPYGVVMVTN